MMELSGRQVSCLMIKGSLKINIQRLILFEWLNFCKHIFEIWQSYIYQQTVGIPMGTNCAPFEQICSCIHMKLIFNNFKNRVSSRNQNILNKYSENAKPLSVWTYTSTLLGGVKNKRHLVVPLKPNVPSL